MRRGYADTEAEHIARNYPVFEVMTCGYHAVMEYGLTLLSSLSRPHPYHRAREVEISDVRRQSLGERLETDKSGSYKNRHVVRESAGEGANGQQNHRGLIGTSSTQHITETTIQGRECASG